MKNEKQRVNIIPATRRHMQSGDQFRKQEKLRVAAYCRVSTEEESQQNSYAVQKRYYTTLILSRSGWEMAGIYADATVIIGLKQNPTNGRRFSPIFLLYRAFCGAKHRMPL